MSQCDDLQKDVTQAAVSTPDLLVTCTTLLMTSSAVIYANSIESVLLTIGLHSTAMGLALLDHLLRNTSLSGTEDGGEHLQFKICNQSVLFLAAFVFVQAMVLMIIT